MKKRDSIFLLLILFLIMVGLFYGTGAETRELLIFTISSALLAISFFLIRYYYLTDKNSLKQRVISICISFVLITLFYIVVREFAGFSLNYSTIILFTISLLIFTLWEQLDLTLLEKGILVLTLVTILAVRAYDVTTTTPANSIQLYRSELRGETSYEKVQDILVDDFRGEFTREDFRSLEPYLQQHPLRSKQPALLEFEGGKMILVETAYQESDGPLRVNNITLLPEEIASYFRYYPLEIKRDVNFPTDSEQDETIIEARGAFIGRATFQQERDWYDQLIGVFGEEELWEESWQELDGVFAPEGPVVGAGTNSGGYLEFKFDEDWEPEKKVLDRIYEVFREKASKYGISDLPVVFKWRVR
ncbi:MAG: hypothetical protein FH756_17710 [Firmicutes bacterium]|nr:hypothetical protein [Bacillota bacterium]